MNVLRRSVAAAAIVIAGSYDWGDERSLLWAIDLVDTDLSADGFESGDTSAWSITVP